jgi:cell fate regulator YaaT (PSP1 superfamily)
MPTICGVRFRGAGKVYHFDPRGLSLNIDDYVIVNTSRGDELAQVAMANREAEENELVGELKPVLRRAASLDLLEAERYRQQENEAVKRCQEQVDKSDLEMRVVGAEYSYDGSRLTFFFTAEKRVDFRALVRDLARMFKTRIELRQIGVRDEAKLIGGCGPCGRSLCCATWLSNFSPVSIRMAKQQDLPLSPMEISGLCGRLLCCLTYENEQYREIKSQFPRVGRTVDSPLGPVRVLKVCVFRETVSVLLQDGSRTELSAAQLEGTEPINPPDDGAEADDALDAMLREQEAASSREPRNQPRPSGQSRNQQVHQEPGDRRASQKRTAARPSGDARDNGGSDNGETGRSRRRRPRNPRRNNNRDSRGGDQES